MRAYFLSSVFLLSLLFVAAPATHAQPVRWAQTAITTAAATPPTSVWEGTAPATEKTYPQPADFERSELRISKEKSLEKFVLRAILFFLGFLSVILLGVLVYGGYKILIARGEEEPYTQGKKIITNGIIGFVIIILSYALINEVLSSTSIFRTIFAIFG